MFYMLRSLLVLVFLSSSWILRAQTCADLGSRVAIQIGRHLRDQGEWKIYSLGQGRMSMIQRWVHGRSGEVKIVKDYSYAKNLSVDEKRRAQMNDWVASRLLQRLVLKGGISSFCRIADIQPIPKGELISEVDNFYGEDLEKYHDRVHNNVDLRPLLRAYQRAYHGGINLIESDPAITIVSQRETGGRFFSSKEIKLYWKAPENPYPEMLITIHLKPSNFIVLPNSFDLVLVDPN